MANLINGIKAFANGVSEGMKESKNTKIKQKNDDYEFEKERIERKIAGAKVNHILHLLLCFPTVGFWVIPWFFMAMSAGSRRREAQSELNELYRNHKILQQANSTQEESKPSDFDYIDKLEKIASLREKNLITEEEYLEQKAKIIKS
jgi:hypothetical protein